MDSTNPSGFVGVLGRSTKPVVNFKCSEKEKILAWYPVMLEVMPPQGLNLVEMAVTESISQVVLVLITLKMPSTGISRVQSRWLSFRV